jgi:hypothetical protein
MSSALVAAGCEADASRRPKRCSKCFGAPDQRFLRHRDHDVLLRSRTAPFHAQYAEHHAAIRIETGAVLVGELPSRALKLVSEWAALHHAELEANWSRARDGGIPEPIDPLP